MARKCVFLGLTYMVTANLAYESDPLGGKHKPNAHASPKILVTSCHLQACVERS